MTVLGIDTSTAATTACVLRADGEAFEVAPEPERLGVRPGHAAELMPAVADVMKRAAVGFGDLEAIAVGIGPGTFTGLRIGVASARALASAATLELRPVSSLAALAAGIDAPLRLALIDAKREEVFASLHGAGGELWAPFAADPEALVARVAELDASPRAAGDGAIRFREVLETAGIEVEPDGSQTHVVRGLNVCRLGADAPAVAPEAVLPDYLRQPDAKPASQ